MSIFSSSLSKKSVHHVRFVRGSQPTVFWLMKRILGFATSGFEIKVWSSLTGILEN